MSFELPVPTESSLRSSLDAFRGVARVQVDGQTRRQIVNGTLDDTSGRACASDTQFQLASVSKQFTAAVVLCLADRGVLSIEDEVSTWIDDCPSGWRGMTIRHLLAHAAGLPHWRDIPQLDLRAPTDPADELKVFFETPLREVPGAAWSYSSPGYVLLAHVAQNATGQPYRDLVDELIFTPLEMTSSFVGAARDHANAATGHFAGEPVPSFELEVVGMGAGDVWTTAEDFSKWNRSLMQGSLLSAPSSASMFAEQASVDSEQAALNGLPNDESMTTTAYGFGWFIGTMMGKRVLFHPGDNFGFVALNLFVPDDNLSLFVMSNEETNGELAIPLLAELLGST